MKRRSKDDDTVLVTDKNFNETDYLISNPEIAEAVQEGVIESGRKHFDLYGRNEKRRMRVTPGKMQQLYSRAIGVLFAGSWRIIPQFLGIKRPPSANSNPLVQLHILETRVNDLETMLNQVMSILARETSIPPPPPKHLQIRVSARYVSYFMESGYTSIYPMLNRVLRSANKELKDFQSILDFGCGCGRATRALAMLVPNSRLYGTDIDGEAIEWLKQHYSRFGEFALAPHLPPTAYPDEKFDLIFGISVLTHLPEEMQFEWLKELRRITKPNGFVILTTHGENHYRELDASIVEIMNKKGFFYRGAESFNYGRSVSLPDFYQTAFHSHTYIKREWQRYFDVVDIQALGSDNYQDTVLLQKRP